MKLTPVSKHTPYLNLGYRNRSRPLLPLEMLQAEGAIADVHLSGLMFRYSNLATEAVVVV